VSISLVGIWDIPAEKRYEGTGAGDVLARSP
jgi:hypothetical protein